MKPISLILINCLSLILFPKCNFISESLDSNGNKIENIEITDTIKTAFKKLEKNINSENNIDTALSNQEEEYYFEDYEEYEDYSLNLYEERFKNLQNISHYSCNESYPSANFSMENGDSIFVSVENEACDVYQTFHTIFINREITDLKKEVKKFTKDMLYVFDFQEIALNFIESQEDIRAGFSKKIKIDDYLEYVIEVDIDESGTTKIHLNELTY